MASRPPKRGTIISRVLAAVHAGKAHSLHAIARRAGLSPRYASAHLAHLRRRGFVKLVRGGTPGRKPDPGFYARVVA